MRREDIKELVKGPISTVPTPFNNSFKIDYGRMRDLTEWWVENGLVKGKAVIKVAAAMGEGPMLREDEWPRLLRTAVQAADQKAAIMCGIHYKDTLRAIEDAKLAQDLGAIGVQISPPVFNFPDQDAIVRHFGDISDAIDGIGILVYVTRGLPGGPIYPETFRRMVDFEHLVAVKWGNPAGTKYEDLFDLSNVINIIDNNGTPILNHQLGGKGYINHTSQMNPAHDLKIWELMESGLYDDAQAVYDSVEKDPAFRQFNTKVAQRTCGEAYMVKGMMAVMGQPAGPPRPPSLAMNAEELTELHQIMEAWGWPVAPNSDIVKLAAS
ncbi:MAG: dihydrodipicolinate synthase family protein [SAR202 cluster bacterium]|jgi:4-hydroxy-tetrahydrodipicolinate synthase|nr:dihydrodipicolinate synthase family protein [SAR202 cluster bacterium]